MQLLPLYLALVLSLALCSDAATAGQHFPNFDFNAQYTWPNRVANGSRVSVGYEASPGDFPSIVAVYLPGGLCGGTLIAPNAVLTAAHCTTDWTRESMIANTRLYIGLLSRNNIAGCNAANGCEARRIKDFVVNPNYSKTNAITVGDVAILILDTPSTIKPAPMAKTKPAPGKTQRLAGWGIMASSQSTAINLMYTDVKVVTDFQCEFSPDFYDAQGSICSVSTGSWPNNYTATACQGDSGGPLYNVDVTPPEIIGSVSYGVLPDESALCGTYIRTVFMSVSYYSDWINSVLAAIPTSPPSMPSSSPPLVFSPPPSPSPLPSPLVGIPPSMPPRSPRSRPPPPKRRRSPPPPKRKRKPPPPSPRRKRKPPPSAMKSL